MRVFFEEYHWKDDDNRYYARNEFYFYGYDCGCITPIQDAVKKSFDNVKVYSEKIGTSEILYHVYFKFDNAADEAFFQIWSNDGIEI